MLWKSFDGLLRFRSVVGLAVGFCALILILFFYADDLGVFLRLSSGDIALIFGLSVLSLILIANRTRIILGVMGNPIGLGESLMIVSFTTLGNMILPLKGGLGLRAAYLKKKHKFNLGRNMGLIVASHMIEFLFLAVLGLSLTFFSGTLNQRLILAYSAVIFGVLAMPALACVFKRFMCGSRLMSALGFDFSMISLRNAAGMVMTEALVSATTIWRIKVVVDAMGLGVESSGIPLIILVPTMVALLNLVPAGIGVYEAATGLAAGYAGDSFQSGVFIGILERAAVIASTLSVAIVFAAWGRVPEGIRRHFIRGVRK
jgi:uncharacterized membrane protein YbhN (UPF0104 family)